MASSASRAPISHVTRRGRRSATARSKASSSRAGSGSRASRSRASAGSDPIDTRPSSARARIVRETIASLSSSRVASSRNDGWSSAWRSSQRGTRLARFANGAAGAAPTGTTFRRGGRSTYSGGSYTNSSPSAAAYDALRSRKNARASGDERSNAIMIGRRERRASSARSSATARVKTSTRRTANDRTRLPSIDSDARAFPTLISNGSELVDACKITMLQYGRRYRTAASTRSSSPSSPP